jgi:hypothetical protein
MNQALRPTSLPDIEPVQEVEEQVIESVKEDEEDLALVARTRGWEKIVEYIDQINKELDDMVLQALQAGVDFEEIGKRTIVKELTREALNKLKNRVEDARAAVDNR